MDDPGIHAAVDVLLAADTADVSRDELGALVRVAAGAVLARRR